VNVKQKIGALIAKHRKQKGITQEKLGFLTDLHSDYIGKVERGERIPSLESVLKIITSLGVKYGKFFEELE
jgi:transcriptional regulator with XRE-family HTH domain